MPLAPILITCLAGGFVPYGLEESIRLRIAVSTFTGSKSFIAGPVKYCWKGISKYILTTGFALLFLEMLFPAGGAGARGCART